MTNTSPPPERTTKSQPAAVATELDRALGLRIRDRRRVLGVSQTALADAIGVTFQQIQKYERGFNRVSFSRLVDIAHRLDCRITELIEGLEPEGQANPLVVSAPLDLRDPDATKLLEAYSAAPQHLQKVILNLVRTIAKDQEVAR